MINRRQSRRTIVAFIGVCIIIVAASLLILSQLEIDLFSDDHITSSPRRFLQSIKIDEESIYSYAEKGLIPVTESPNPKNEVSLFWHYRRLVYCLSLLLIFAFCNCIVSNQSKSIVYKSNQIKSIVY